MRVASAVVAITVCVGLTGLAATGSARAQAPVSPERDAAGMRARMERMRADLVQARLDSAAARLEIRASQEPAWNAFAAGVKALFAAPPGAGRPPERAAQQPEDAATRLHRRATAELARAQNLARLADATSKLQAVLDPNQREVLDQIVRMQLDRGPDRLGFGMGGQRVIIRRAAGPGPGPNATFRYRRQLPDGPAQIGGAAPDAPPSPPGPP